jgi:uncharacterized protein (DUF1015 family)
MVDIIPFKGITYNIDKIKKLELVLVPPYDVITTKMQRVYYDRHPYNIIRIIYGKDYPDDNVNNNKYTRAKEHFQRWQKEGIFIRSKKPLLYLYKQTYYINNKRRTRSGIIALVRIEEYNSGKILPHEETFESPKEDRLKLIKECGANFSQIFSLYSDPSNRIITLLEKSSIGSPFIELFYDKVEHRLWEIDDPLTIDITVRLMKDKNIVIADGHHRYEAALNYRNFMRKVHKEDYRDSMFNYTMMYLSNIYDEGLTILPTHRIISNIYNNCNFLDKIKEYFDIKVVKNEEVLEKNLLKEREHTFGIVYNKFYYVIKLKNYNIIDNILSDINPLLKKLDVTILHSLIIKKLLNIKEDDISYTKDSKEAIDIALKDNTKIAIILNPINPLYIMDIARANLRMPHKATFFYPKLLTGLVINSINSNYDK